MEEKGMGRIVIVPVPAQGHITPAMQLGKALYFKGFAITVAQTECRPLSPSDDFPGFQFFTIPGSLSESEFKSLGPVEFLLKLNQLCETSFKNCMNRLLQQQGGNNIACVIYDEYMYFAEAAAKEFKLPSLVFSTTSATAFVCRCVLGTVLEENQFLASLQEPGAQDMLVPGFDFVRYKHLPTSAFATLESTLKLYRNTVHKRTASAAIINTASCIESLSLACVHKKFQAPVYAVGPLHAVAPVPCSLQEEDWSCIEWLNKQRFGSVLYISLGSLALMQHKEVVEMAQGLVDSDHPFLWVIRPGSIPGSEWTESLPEELRRRVAENGRIVKWAPQQEVLAHCAVGGFWSHCGWNSTLESMGEGVPMICRPFSGDQKVNAQYLDCVWRIGIQVEGELKRREVERAVRRLMEEEEGRDMRKRALHVQAKLKAAVTSGGSSCTSFDELVSLIQTLREGR